MIKGIVCVAENSWAIGKNNGLLFRLKKDMQNFQQKTTEFGANIVVMGENTLKSFPGSKPLKGRVNLVLCADGHEYEDCICFHDFNQLLKFIQILAKDYTIWVIGGGMFYKSMIPYYDEVIVTKVAADDPEATVFFPCLDNMNEFYIADESDVIEDNGYNIRFVTYKRTENK